jgi:hypothetical protein
MIVTPIASATPDGRVRIADGFSLTDEDLRSIESREEWHRNLPVHLSYMRAASMEDALEESWQDFVSSATEDAEILPEELEASRIGHRKSVIAAGVENRRYSYSIGDAVREGKSRTHELKKSKLRLARRR